MVRRRNPPGQPDPRGGARQGAPGRAYPNRSDMTAAPSQPVRTAPGQPYGEAGAQAASQAAVPLPQVPPPAGPGAAHAAAAAYQMPTPGAFDRPTERPGEPLTHGLPSGPGGGSEVLGGALPADNLGALLAQAAATQGASPDVKALAQWVQRGPR